MSMFSFTLNPPKCSFNDPRLSLGSPSHELFDTFAKELAEEISKPELLIERRQGGRSEWRVQSDKDANKPTQVRKFYDELCMWAERTQTEADLQDHLPFIKMMNAKVAYARGRELVDDKFTTWFAASLSQLRETDKTGLATFRNFRTLFEAFMGFYKLARPK